MLTASVRWQQIPAPVRAMLVVMGDVSSTTARRSRLERVSIRPVTSPGDHHAEITHPPRAGRHRTRPADFDLGFQAARSHSSMRPPRTRQRSFHS
jgi:hypothetical protein